MAVNFERRMSNGQPGWIQAIGHGRRQALRRAAGMPLPWTVAGGPYVVVLSAVVVWFTGRRRFPPKAALEKLAEEQVKEKSPCKR